MIDPIFLTFPRFPEPWPLLLSGPRSAGHHANNVAGAQSPQEAASGSSTLPLLQQGRSDALERFLEE